MTDPTFSLNNYSWTGSNLYFFYLFILLDPVQRILFITEKVDEVVSSANGPCNGWPNGHRFAAIR